MSAGYRIGRSIPLALQRKALAETAGYVLAKMDKAVAFKSPTDLLVSAANRCREQTGMALEFGVWKGRSLRILCKIFDKIYGFDSFRGLPEDWQSGMVAGTFALDRPPRAPENADLIVGWFHETLEGFLATHPDRIKFLHVDCDLYSSTRTVLSACAERLDAGSIIVFDEYFNYPNWREGEFRAFQEIVLERGIAYRYLGYVSADQQVVIEITAKDGTTIQGRTDR